MEKKLTKKELKEIEEIKRQKRSERFEVISAIENYWDDLSATERYYKINNPEKIDYYGNLKDEAEKEKLKSRYHALDFIKIKYEKDDVEQNVINFVRAMTRIDDEVKKYRTDRELIVSMDYMQDGIWFDDNFSIWSFNEFKLYMELARKFGYDYIIYTHSSTSALEDLSVMVKMGAKVIDYCTTRSYEDVAKGLVLDIREINLEK